MSVFNQISEPQETYTLDQFISLKDSDKITYPKYSIMERSLTNPELVYSIDNVIYGYMDELKRYRKIVTVGMNDKIKYQYKPKLLSYDIYGSTEAYFIILAMNGMCNLKEFTLEENRFFALTPSHLAMFMNDIYNAERRHIVLNRTNLGIYES